jgi:hypothetical protein
MNSEEWGDKQEQIHVTQFTDSIRIRINTHDFPLAVRNFSADRFPVWNVERPMAAVRRDYQGAIGTMWPLLAG